LSRNAVVVVVERERKRNKESVKAREIERNLLLSFVFRQNANEVSLLPHGRNVQGESEPDLSQHTRSINLCVVCANANTKGVWPPARDP
jgi:hypothetical protein